MTLTEEEVEMIHRMRTAKVRLRILSEIRQMPRVDAVMLLVEAMIECAPEMLEFMTRMNASNEATNE